ncbi:hypothetical protein SAMN04487897_103280 [Paenibacillus sp. yr247]|uniref:hypothetical protein n=1 Tax=Paenibacillus sp. yr247 TaxID=1761880 RepID=UPI0008848BB6|nr:hypothetical protein [Paenibacillus sp. yr247]SDN59540.1 hypothetical protein SAMN04487897_103280 [Paenibacillus sp. yr247]
MSDEARIKYYDFSKFPPIPGVTPLTPLTVATTAATQTTLATLKLKHIRPDDRQVLSASIDLTFTGTIPAQTGALTVATLTVTYRIWRDAVNTGTLVAQFRDTLATQIAAAATTFTAIGTTSFKVTDTLAPKGNHTYFLTAEVTGFSALNAAGAAVAITTPVVSVGSLELNGFVVDENES